MKGRPAVFALVIGGWMVKNEVLFGRFTLSTWSGMNLHRAVIPLLHVEDRKAMQDSGELSQVSAVYSFRWRHSGS